MIPVKPPVLLSVPPCEMAIIAESDTHSDNDDSDDKHADMMLTAGLRNGICPVSNDIVSVYYEYFDDNEQAALYIVENLDKSNTIFLKASRAMKFEQILEKIKE